MLRRLLRVKPRNAQHARNRLQVGRPVSPSRQRTRRRNWRRRPSFACCCPSGQTGVGAVQPTARPARVALARSPGWFEKATSSVSHAASLSAPERAGLSALSFPMSWRWLKPSRAALARRFRSTARKPPDGSGSVPRCQPHRCSSPAPRAVRYGLATSPSR